MNFEAEFSDYKCLLLMKFLIHKRIKKKKKPANKRAEGTLTKVTPPLGSLQLDQPLLDCGLPLIVLDCSDQPYVLSNWWLQLSLHLCQCPTFISVD